MVTPTPAKSNANNLQTMQVQTRARSPPSALLRPKIKFSSHHPLQLNADYLPHLLNLITGKSTNKPLTSKNPQDLSHISNHFSQGIRDTHGGKIHLETPVLQHLLNCDPASTGIQFPESTCRPESMVGTTQQQITIFGNNSLPGSPSCSGEKQ